MTQPTGTTGPPPLPPTPRSQRHRAWRAAGLVALAVLGAAVIAGNFVRVPYVLISPGDATALDERVITISGTPTFQDSGDFLYLTVRFSPSDPSLWRYLLSKLDGDVTVTKREDAIGCASYAESARLQRLLMRESQQVAKTAALTRLGYEVVEEASRIVIINVLCDGPSSGLLFPGDEVTAVDDHPVTVAEEVGPLVQSHAPGDHVRLTVRRDGVEQDVTIRAGHTTQNPRHACVASAGGSGDAEACVGIQGQDIPNRHFPFRIRIDTRRVSGPSAGLAFTLAIIDDLTDGSLTGGRRIAVTGAMVIDGRVAPVGGVEQKAVVASRAGATLMLVPACPKPLKRSCEAKPAREHADGMRVVVVETIDDALKALERAGGDPVPPRPDVATGQEHPVGQ